jgi:3-hydroxyisobutyrate dehydrogenase-like beta-hydroxyacid dehydrogenase
MAGTVGFVGVGRMGSRMATNLIEDGYEVVVRDVDPARVEQMEAAGAASVDSLAEMAAATDVVITSLPDTAAVEEVYLGEEGLLVALREGSMVVETSTVQPAAIEAIAAAVDDRDVDVVDCPVIGPTAAAADRTLTTVVGADDAALERARPLLERLGERLDHVGGPGDGTRVKLAHNVMNYGNWVLGAEMLALVERMGLDPEQFFDIVDDGHAASPIFAEKATRYFEGDFDPGFPIDGARGDLQCALEMKEANDYPAPAAAAVAEQFALASAMTGGEDDYAVMAELFRSLGE